MEYTQERTAMLHQIPSPAFIAENGVITDVNPAARQLQLIPGTVIDTILATGKEEYAQFSDGCLYLTIRICGIESSASVTRTGSSDLFVVEQDADQAELQSMAVAAQALRSPLSSVMTVAEQLFPLVSAEDDPQAQAQVARINKGLYQILRIVCNMSDAYRYRSDSSPRTEIRDVSALVREQFQLSAPLIAQSGITLNYTGPEESIFCLVDAEKLERAIGNILSNAMKFTPGGGRIDARFYRRSRMLYLTVQDSGTGLTRDVRWNLHNRWQRQPGIEDSRFGLGLGMLLIRSAATAHGGTVLTEQGENFGFRLTMTIPIRQSGDPMVRSPMIHVDYAGERDHRLLELSDSLSAELYSPENLR